MTIYCHQMSVLSACQILALQIKNKLLQLAVQLLLTELTNALSNHTIRDTKQTLILPKQATDIYQCPI